MTNGHDPEVRTYRGRTLEEVLPQIRAELGPDAVIVRQRDGLMGGIGGFFQQQFVEVEARAGAMRFDAYDDEPALPGPLPPDAGDAADESAAPAASAPTAPAAAAPTAPAPAAAAAEPSSAPTEATASAAPAEPAAAAPTAPAPTTPARPTSRAAQFAAQAEAAAPAPGKPERQPGKASGGRMTAAQLLAQATGADANDPRTPAEILREHSATFASQLAAAEERAEPIVIANPPAPEQEPTGRYAPPVPAAPRREAPAPKPAPAAAEVKPEPGVRRAAAKRRRAPARAPRARAARAARAAKPAAQSKPAAAKPAVEAKPAPVLDEKPEPPTAGVGPQTTQALELAAALAASVTTRTADPEPLEAAPLDDALATDATVPAAAATTDAPTAARPAPTRPADALPRQAPRRGIFGRRRAVAIPLAKVAASPAAAAVTDALAERGIAPAVARDVLVDAAAHVLPFAADGDLRGASRIALSRRIPTPEPPRIGGRAVAFVGAGGTGKTRCVAGLAAAYAGGSTVEVVVISLAPGDGGAELTALLKDHGIKVETFATAKAAAARIAQARAESLVVVDTPAVAPGDTVAIEALAAELGLLALDETQLTVPATLGAPVAQEQLERLAPLAPTGIALTHADETEHIGAVVELSCATRLPLAYVNSGLALPGALAPADPMQLAERLLP